MDKVSKRLEQLIADNKIDFLSISGGGDPLYNLNYERMGKYISWGMLCKYYGIEYELHTSYVDYGKSDFPAIFNTVVYHCRSFEELNMIARLGNETVRVVFVVQEHFTKKYIDKIEKFVQDSDIITQLSFRQRIDGNYQETFTEYEYLKSGHGTRWHYIEQNDYNNYIVNDEIYTCYQDIGKKVIGC